MLLLYVCMSVCGWVVMWMGGDVDGAVAELWKRENRAQEEAKGGQSGYKKQDADGHGWE